MDGTPDVGPNGGPQARVWYHGWYHVRPNSSPIRPPYWSETPWQGILGTA